MITQKKLKEFLESSCDYGYPEEYRNVIWCVLLRLPVNKDAFLDLKSREAPQNVATFTKSLKCLDMPQNEVHKFTDLISNLINWSPILASIDYIPGLVYPFTKIFPNSQLLTFEIVATILLNYGQLWFEFHPLEPFNFLGMCEDVLMLMDAGLATFYHENNITPEMYAWYLVKTSFTEVLSESFWFTLWDTIVSNPPYFLVFIIVAFNSINRYNIMRQTCFEDIVNFFKRKCAMHIKRIIRMAHEMDADYPECAHPKKFYTKFMPIPKHYYPVFDSYPREDGFQLDDFDLQISEVNFQEKDFTALCDNMRDKLEEESRSAEAAKQMRGELIYICFAYVIYLNYRQ